MWILKQFDSLVIDDFEEEVYSYPDHAHAYYEMVYIHKGSGTHHLNALVLPYRAGDLFLLAPGDHHFFDIKKSTHFTFIKFTDSYYQVRQHLMPHNWQMHTPASLMQLKIFKESKLVLDEPSRTILRKSVENIVAYDKHHKEAWASPVIFYQLLSILGIVREAAGKEHVIINGHFPKTEEISSYIHQHIHNRDNLQIPAIAGHFNIAPAYFSTYFKRCFGMGYRNYTDQYRNKLIEKRLLTGRLTLKQIATEFGFTDESHLVKYFRKQVGMSPSEFKEQIFKGNETIEV